MPNNKLSIGANDTLWDRLQQYLNQSIWLLVKIALLLTVLRAFVLEPGIVDGQSMEPTLHDNHRILISKFTTLFDDPDRYDVVQFSNEEGQLFVKRVIGLPGEQVIFKQNSIFIQSGGEEFQLSEYYLPETTITKVPYGQETEFYVPENSYFLVGDNRLFSTDSRVYGPIHRRQIYGKVLYMN